MASCGGLIPRSKIIGRFRHRYWYCTLLECAKWRLSEQILASVSFFQPSSKPGFSVIAALHALSFVKDTGPFAKDFKGPMFLNPEDFHRVTQPPQTACTSHMWKPPED